MSIDFIRPEVEELRPRISVIGVGGAGGNAIANMIQSDVQGVDFIVANTDAQALNHSLADRKIQLGLKITQGLGAGSRPEIGKAAAEEALAEIEAALTRRKEARAAKDFAASDALRDELAAQGVEVMDGDPLGWDWKPALA